jgi:uncharacterized coiled-coil DUF342 family protein
MASKIDAETLQSIALALPCIGCFGEPHKARCPAAHRAVVKRIVADAVARALLAANEEIAEVQLQLRASRSTAESMYSSANQNADAALTLQNQLAAVTKERDEARNERDAMIVTYDSASERAEAAERERNEYKQEALELFKEAAALRGEVAELRNRILTIDGQARLAENHLRERNYDTARDYLGRVIEFARNR